MILLYYINIINENTTNNIEQNTIRVLTSGDSIKTTYKSNFC